MLIGILISLSGTICLIMVKETAINFANLNGIVGIFGKNFSGKSSIIDGLLYTMFNTTSKNERKNYNIINQNRKDCRGLVELQVGDKIYTLSVRLRSM